MCLVQKGLECYCTKTSKVPLHSIVHASVTDQHAVKSLCTNCNSLMHLYIDMNGTVCIRVLKTVTCHGASYFRTVTTVHITVASHDHRPGRGRLCQCTCCCRESGVTLAKYSLRTNRHRRFLFSMMSALVSSDNTYTFDGFYVISVGFYT